VTPGDGGAGAPLVDETQHRHSMTGLPLCEVPGERPHVAVRCKCRAWRFCCGDGTWFADAPDADIIAIFKAAEAERVSAERDERCTGGAKG